MGRKEILKTQIAIPCPRPKKPTPEGLQPHQQEHRGALELEACRPKNGKISAMTENHAQQPLSCPFRTLRNRMHSGSFSLCNCESWTETREAEEAARAHLLSE